MRWAGIALLCLPLWVLLGCGEKVEDAPTVSAYEQARKASAKSKKKKKVAKKKPAVKQGSAATAKADFGVTDEAFVYDPTTRRDPFHSFALDSAGDNDDATRGPLEYFDLAQLDLAAVILSEENPQALIYDPSGRGYIVGLGTAIGKRQGRIISFGDGSMTVQETHVDYSGIRTARNVELKIRHMEGG